jgi:hypothetical protein
MPPNWERAREDVFLHVPADTLSEKIRPDSLDLLGDVDVFALVHAPR